MLLAFTLAFAEDETSVVNITLEASGTRAWIVTAVEGAEDIVELDTQNPTLTLTPGVRYQFDLSGVDSGFHPLDFRDEEGNFLLAQGERTTGSFEDAEAVAFTHDDDQVSFTLTDALAAELQQIFCTNHPPMQIDVEIAEVDAEAAEEEEDEPTGSGY